MWLDLGVWPFVGAGAVFLYLLTVNLMTLRWNRRREKAADAVRRDRILSQPFDAGAAAVMSDTLGGVPVSPGSTARDLAQQMTAGTMRRVDELVSAWGGGEFGKLVAHRMER
ncbi:MAG: hypothetical protein M3R26_00055 [Actinomycetota bacterium]|nr:hypothetical protein [Actinomycetota bacterium]